jgi:hypothetical protein
VHDGPREPVPDRPAEGAAFTAVTRRRRRAPAAVALAAIAFLGFAVLSKEAAPAVGLPIASLTPAPVANVGSPSAAPTLPATSPSPALAPPSRNPTATPYPVAFDVPVPDGVAQIIPAGPTQIRLTVSLPRGWRENPAMYYKPSDTAEVGLSIGAWRIQHVNTFPCRWATPIFSDPLYPATAEGLADALSSWWGQDPNSAFYSNSLMAPIASKPRLATIAGRPAWYVEVLIPSDFDLSQCDGGQLVLWETADGVVRSALRPTEHNRLWVVDVHGEQIVIDASSPLTPTPADAAELQAIVDSIRFGN